MALVTKLFKHFQIQLTSKFCSKTIVPMQIGLKMISKMRLNDRSRALTLLKKEYVSKVKLGSATKKKRKGKSIASKTPKRKRHILLQDEEEEDDDDETIFAIALRDLQGFADSKEEEEDESEKEPEEESDGEDTKVKESEDDDSKGDANVNKEHDETDKEGEDTREIDAPYDEEMGTSKQTRAGKEKVQEGEVTSQISGTKTRGVGDKTLLTEPTASDGISRSPPNAEDIFASHYPEVSPEGLHKESNVQGEQRTSHVQVDVPSLLDTPPEQFAEASAQTKPKSNYP